MKIDKKQAKERIDKLRQSINDYRYRYHVLDESTLSEAAADSLKHELAQLEEQFPEFITPDSPTQRVAGEPLSKFSQVRHTSRMLSLNDAFGREEVEAWLKRINKLAPGRELELFADLKMDGLACALHYEDGVFVRALTRGNGIVGEDVSANIRTIESVPMHLRGSKTYASFLQGRTEVRGEVVIYKKDFDELNREREKAGQALYANPRNTAAGSIRQLDPKLAAARPLRFRAWDLHRDNAGDVPTYDFAYKALKELGFAANSQAELFDNLDKLMKFADKWEKGREKLPFYLDGLVIKLNDRALYDDLGVVGKAPRAAVAYKYPAEEATSVIKDIVISIGRTGAATPVAVVEPVAVAGTTVKHASLHNADEIARKDVRIGDTAVIFKAGDIIPQVQKILEELRPKTAKKFEMEKELKRQYPELEFVRPEGEAVYRVKGASGPLLLKRALQHFASKGALDIEGLGEKNVIALVDAGLVKDLADIYLLKKEQILDLERFADISADNLIRAVKASKHPELPRFIFGLGIRHVGAQTAIDLAERFGSLDQLADANIDEILAVEGVGSIVAESIIGWFADPDNQELLKKFNTLGVKPVYESRAKGPLHGKKFVVTGTLETMGRDLAAEKIRGLGGTFQTSIGKDTDYLVVGSNVGAGKLKKAEKLGTKQLKEVDLLEMLR